MKKAWGWFTGLGLFAKIALIAGIIIAAVFIWDFLTGGLSDVKGYINDKVYEQRMKKDADWQKEVDQLRLEKQELVKQAVEAKAKEAFFEEREKELSAKSQQELQKLEEALKAQDAVEAETAQETDAYTRCERTKQKMLQENIKSAQEINCETFKQ
jgi:hypothetical protein